MLNLGIGIGIDSSIGGAVPFKSDLQTWHKGLTNDTFNESLVPFNGKILPHCAKFNGTNNYLNKTDKYLVGGTAIDITVKLFTGASTAARGIFSFGGNAIATAGIMAYIAATTRVLTIQSSNGSTTTASATFGALATNTYYEIRIQWDGVTGGIMTVTINGTPQTSVNTQSWTGNSEDHFSIGCYRPTSPLAYFSGNIYEYQDTDQHYYISGLGAYEYNTIGATQLTWRGDGRVKTFNANASRYYFTNGYKIYKKAGQPNEYLPTGATATTIVAAGYALAEYDTYAGSTDDWNMYPSMVDMNPTSSADAKLAIFDRSNATRCSALARVDVASGGTYIDTTPFQWGILEITDPRITTEFFNVGYAGRIAAKVETQLSGGNYYIKKYKEQLNYATDKTGTDQLKVMNYCKTNVFAL